MTGIPFVVTTIPGRGNHKEPDTSVKEIYVDIDTKLKEKKGVYEMIEQVKNRWPTFHSE